MRSSPSERGTDGRRVLQAATAHPRTPLRDHHRLEDWVPIRCPIWRKLVDDVVEGHLLICQRATLMVPRSGNEIAKRRIPDDVDLERNGPHKESDQILELRASVIHGDAHDCGVLSAAPRDECAERGNQDRKQRASRIVSDLATLW